MSPEPIQPRVDIYPKTIDTKWARMKYWLSIFFTFNFSLLIFHCGLDIEDPTPPSPPIWVQKSLPEEWPERGIDAHELGGIFIEWQQNAEHNVSAYLIYRSEYFLMNDSLGDFNLLYRLETGNENSLEYLDSDVLLRRTYCYRLRAEDSAQNLSGYSDSIYYELLPSIINNYREH